jgi:hypothetical protein
MKIDPFVFMQAIFDIYLLKTLVQFIDRVIHSQILF